MKSDLVHLQRRAREIATAAVVSETPVRRWTHRLDSVLLHPVVGPIILAAIMFVMFQARVRVERRPRWSGSRTALRGCRRRSPRRFPPGLLRSLVVDGAIAGVGAVITFLPQILILFLFILLLEGTGYMVRAAFLMDKLMHGAGLSGRAFIPLLSSFACAVPGNHGDADHRRPQGPADDDPGRAADDLLGAAAGLHADHRRLHPEPQRRPRRRPAGTGHVRALHLPDRRRAARRAGASPRRAQGRRRRLHDGAAEISAGRRSRTSRSACSRASRSS